MMPVEPGAPCSLRAAMLALASGAAGTAVFDVLGLVAPTRLHAALAAWRSVRLAGDRFAAP